MKKAIAIYARTATCEQGESPEIEQAQRVTQAIPLDDRSKGVRVYAECESGTRGFRRSHGEQIRHELARLARDIAAGDINSVYVEDLVRLARSKQVLDDFVEHCRAHGVGIYAMQADSGQNFLDACSVPE